MDCSSVGFVIVVDDTAYVEDVRNDEHATFPLLPRAVSATSTFAQLMGAYQILTSAPIRTQDKKQDRWTALSGCRSQEGSRQLRRVRMAKKQGRKTSEYKSNGRAGT